MNSLHSDVPQAGARASSWAVQTRSMRPVLVFRKATKTEACLALL